MLFNNFVNKVQALPSHEERRYSKYSTATLRWAWTVVLSRGFKLPSGDFNDDAQLSGRPCLIPGSGAAPESRHARGCSRRAWR